MTITAADIVLVKSQNMTDADEGGGAPVADVVVDRRSNTVFPDISEVDRAMGRVQMRKLYLAVRTPDTDTLLGANLIVARPPQDPRVIVNMMTTESQFDRRVAAASRLESYLNAGVTYPALLFGDHIAGQQSLALLHREETPPPVQGDPLCLVYGLLTQYVRATKVTTVVRTFTDSQGEFKRAVSTLLLSDALQYDFPGFDAVRQDATVSYTGKTRVRDVVVADAARYYGTQPLTAAASIGDFNLQAASAYTSLVPSTRVETPIVDARLNQQSATLVKAGAPWARDLTLAFTTGQNLYVGGSILPGSLSVTRGGVTITDKGGLLLDSTGAQVGTVDYTNGVLTLSVNVFGTGSGSHAVTYTPAATPTLVSDSFDMPVTLVTQRRTWTTTIEPLPARGSVRVSYRALGKWYDLVDDGSGALRGSDSSYGAGTVNYATGSVAVTLGALPDVNSSVIVSYVSAVLSLPVTDVPSSGTALARAFGSVIELGRAIKPGTLSLTWNDGTARTATDSAGGLAGDASGLVVYGEGRIYFRPNVLPPAGTVVNIDAGETVQRKESVVVFSDGGADWTATLTGPVKPRTVELAVRALAPTLRSFRITDDGAGNLQIANAAGTFGAAGTINYGTGAVSIPKSLTGVLVKWPTFQSTGDSSSRAGTSLYVGALTTSEYALSVDNSAAETFSTEAWAWWSGKQTNALEARFSGADGSAYSGSVTLTQLFMPLGPNPFTSLDGQSLKASAVMLGSDVFAVSQDNGNVLRNPSPTTGVGTLAGSLAVVAGSAGLLLTAWPSSVSSTPSLVAGATQPDVSGADSLLTVDRVSFRTAVSPLVNTGLNIAGSWATGATFSVTPDTTGTINTGTANSGATPGSLGVFGKVDYEQGLVRVAFGRRVQDADAGQSDVIDVRDLGISGVNYIKSARVQADTLRYNASAYSYLPLDASILGLNTVRLPADGRVPIFRPGTLVVVGHTGSVGPATVSNGQELNCGRGRLSRVQIIGADDTVITSGYTADLDTGIVTIDNVTGWPQPVTLEHRIEDMALVRDVTIDGKLSLTRALTHDYPLGSYVSSALVFGDLFARVGVVFDQATWTGSWSDISTGTAGATFNDAAFPITVTNEGALTERWCLRFLSATTYEVVGEHVGVIANGNTSTVCAPNGPNGKPYFSINPLAFGSGWAAGNAVRFNTVAAMGDAWIIRTTLQGPETVVNDWFQLIGRGDIDRP